MNYNTFSANGSGEVEFNEAIGIIYRLDALQKKVNSSMTNLFVLNAEGLNYEYQDCYSNLTNIFMEISHDCTDKEKSKVFVLQEEIEQTILLPFFNKRRVTSLGGSKIISTPILNNMFKLKKLLEKYRMYINELRKSHGYTNPEKQNSRRAMGS